MILGIDIGGTTVKFGIVTNKGEILATERHDTLENAQTSEDFMGLLIDISKKYIASYPQVKGIGIGIPGQLSLDRTTLVQANNLGALNGTKIVPILKETFPDLISRKLFHEMNTQFTNYTHRIEFVKFLIKIENLNNAKDLAQEIIEEIQSMDLNEKRAKKEILREAKNLIQNTT
jgi:activator of 2-hydroxyglutaryl-CoA dehydratase